MKTFIRFFAVIAFLGTLVAGMTSCSSSGDAEPPTIYATPDAVTFGYDEVNIPKDVVIGASGTDWTVTASESWLRAFKFGDDIIVYVVEVNPLTTPRTGRVYLELTSAGATAMQVVEVVQQAATIELSTAETLYFSCFTPGTKTITLTSQTTDWTVESSDSSWITVTKTSGTQFTVSVQENGGMSKRTGTVTARLAVNGATAALNLTQQITEDLVGSWDVAEYVYMNGWYTNSHTVTITKDTDATVKISNFAGPVAATYGGGSAVVISANIDVVNGTIQIPSQTIGSWYAGCTTYIAGFATGNLNNDRGTDLLPVSVRTGSVFTFTLNSPYGTDPAYYIYDNVTATGVYDGYWWYTSESVWTKNTASPAPPAIAPEGNAFEGPVYKSYTPAI